MKGVLFSFNHCNHFLLMHTIAISPETVAGFRATKAAPQQPAISFNAAGYFVFNKAALELLRLQLGDQFILRYETEDPMNWYIQKVKKDGFEVISKSKSLGVQSSGLTKLLIEKTGISCGKYTVRMLLAGKPTKLGTDTCYGILVNTARHKGLSLEINKP